MSEGARAIRWWLAGRSRNTDRYGRGQSRALEARILVGISPYRQSHALARNCAARGEMAGQPARITWRTVIPPECGETIPWRTSKTPPVKPASADQSRLTSLGLTSPA
jgi:hypothetical protein